MNPRKTFLLLLLLAALSLFIYRHELPDDVVKRESATLLKGAKTAQLESIEISGTAGSFSLKNLAVQSGESDEDLDAVSVPRWELADLPGSELDMGKLNSLLSSIDGFTRGTSLPAAELETDKTVYGLEKPELTVKFKFAKGETRVSFGKKNAYLSKRYAEISDSGDLFMVAEDLFKAANAPRDQFRDATPLDLTEYDLSSLTVDGPDGRILMERDADKGWRLREPYAAQVSQTAVSEYVRSLRTLSAVSFVDGISDKLAEYGLETPLLKVVAAFSADSKKPALDIRLASSTKPASEEGEAEGMFLYVSGKPSFYEIGGKPMSGLQRAAEWFREKKLFQFMTESAVQLDLERGPLRLSLVKSGSDWKVNGKEADASKISSLLDGLSELEASGFPVSNHDFGFAAPELKLVVRTGGEAGKTRDYTLTIGGAVSGADIGHGEYYAAVGDLSEPFIISDESFKSLSFDEAGLLKPAVPAADAPDSEVSEAQVQH